MAGLRRRNLPLGLHQTEPPQLFKELKLDDEEHKLYINRAADRLVRIDKTERVELYDMEGGARLKDLELPGRPGEALFTLDGGALSVLFESRLMVIYSQHDGEKLAELRDVGEVFYDPDCQRMHVWTEEGRVMRYTKGWEVLGCWFWPSVRCGD